MFTLHSLTQRLSAYTKHGFDIIDVILCFKNLRWFKSTQVVYRKHLHQTFFRIQIFSDTKFPQSFPDPKVPDLHCICEILYRFHAR